MSCNFFVDYTRECCTRIKHLPANTFNFCTTDRYLQCPFRIFLEQDKKAKWCNYIDKCNFFNGFNVHDFEVFANIAKKFCLSENHSKCRRYNLKESGKDVPSDLSPE